jgi:uncharacterized protein
VSTRCLFASDLHGRLDRYEKLLAAIEAERPDAVLLGGDLLPRLAPAGTGDFLPDWLSPRLRELRARLGSAWPRVLAIFGNDDPRSEAESLRGLERQGLVEHVHGRRASLGGRALYGYACVPPTPFHLKDWERYDVSRYVDPGCVSPEEGVRSVPVPEAEAKWGTIASDLEALAGEDDVSGAVFLFHSPPHRTSLDRADLDGRSFDHAPLDVHVGSIAIRRFIEARQPLLTLHGHVHESARLTGAWMERIGRTVCLSAAHDGPELALVRFDLDAPSQARRELL